MALTVIPTAPVATSSSATASHGATSISPTAHPAAASARAQAAPIPPGSAAPVMTATGSSGRTATAQRPMAPKRGIPGWGSKRTRASMTAGPAAASARSSAPATCWGRSMRSPWAPKPRAMAA